MSLLLLGAGRRAPFDDVYISAANGGDQALVSTTTSYAFSTVTIGPADPRREVVFIFSTQGGTAAMHDAATANAGAVTFSKVAESNSAASTNMSSIWIANVPNGTTLTAPTLTCSAAPARCTLVGYMHGRGSSATDTINQAGNLVSSGNIDHPANGLTIAHGTHTGVGGVPSDFTWVGVTEQVPIFSSGALKVGGGWHNGASAEANRAVSFTTDEASPGNQRLVAAAWGAQV